MRDLLIGLLVTAVVVTATVYGGTWLARVITGPP
jgi:hypothetical protein